MVTTNRSGTKRSRTSQKKFERVQQQDDPKYQVRIMKHDSSSNGRDKKRNHFIRLSNF